MSIRSEKLRHRREQAARDVLKNMGISTWNSYSSGGGGGVGSDWVDQNYIAINFFNELFTIHTTITVVVTDEDDEPVGQPVVTESTLAPNEQPGTTSEVDEETGYTTTTTVAITSIEAKKGLWTDYYLSALGNNGTGGGGGTLNLSDLVDVNISNPTNGQALVYNGTSHKWENQSIGGGGSGTLSSIGLVMPTGFTVSPSTLTADGSFTVSFSSGYSLPTTAKQAQWDAAYNARHSHSNKSVLDGITSTKVSNWDSAYTWTSQTRTTLADYGITDAKIASGVITLGTNTITPWTNSNHPTTISGYGITDAKFGTAGSDYVPITLGSTTKNVLLSTALSGYATQTWVTTQLSSYLPLSGGTMSNTNVVTNMNADLLDGLHKGSFMQNFVEGTADLNDLTDSGSYRLGNGNTNKPSNDNYAQMLVVKGGGDTIAQMYFPYASTKAYIRTGNPLNASGEWKTWREVAFTDSNVASATKLETARSLWGQSFDGTANVTGNMTSVGSISASGEIKTTSGNAFRLANGNYGVIMRNDGSAFHILLTDSGSAASGSYNSLRPFFINLSTGLVTMKQGLYLIGSNGTYASTSFDSLRIGNGVIMWDSTNNALKVQKYDGTAANLYALGGVSALGFQSGGTSTSISTLNVTSQLNMANESRIYTDESLYIGSPDSNGWVYLADCCSQVGPSKWSIGSDNGAAKFMRVTSPLFYLDDTHYLRYNSGHLQFYNGTSFINLT